MKKSKLFAGLFLVISHGAFAYPHPATGNGYSCKLNIHVSGTASNCKPHVVSESQPDVIRTREFDGSSYTSVTQILDNSECIGIWTTSEASKFSGDVTKENHLKMVAPVFSSRTYPRYNNDDGVIDSEMRHGVQYYLYKEVAKLADEREIRMMDELVREKFAELEISYDDVNKKLNVFIKDETEKSQEYSAAADFAKGVLKNSGGFNFVLTVPGRISAERTFDVQFICTAEK